MVNFFPIFANIPTKHKLSEMEAAPPHKLLSFLNTVYTVYIVYTAYTACTKLLLTLCWNDPENGYRVGTPYRYQCFV